MTDDVAIRVEHVSKVFKLPHEKHSSVKSIITGIGRRKKSYELQQALKNVSFEVKQGEFFGMVGRNGSGKSTMLKLLAGIYSPTNGTVTVNGKLTPFIELGVGFNPELTGRENVFLNGALLGFSRKEMSNMYSDIVAFAELERFMDQKLKNYSSGMQVRLAFSIAIRANTSILLLDEVLAVGDAAFQKKCFAYFRELKKQKRTVVLISHDMNVIEEYCDRAVLIDGGVVVKEGAPETVAQEYLKLFRSNESGGLSRRTDGKGPAYISEVKASLKKRQFTIEMLIKVNEPISRPIIGIAVHSPTGLKVVESNTLWQKIKTRSYKPGEKIKVAWSMPDIFTNGDHTVTAAIVSSDASETYDRWDDAIIFTVDRDEVTTAATRPLQDITITEI
jgi:ABC-2 type transport system ATP-binding protein